MKAILRRLDAIDQHFRARAEAERNGSLDAVWNWIRVNATPAELTAWECWLLHQGEAEAMIAEGTATRADIDRVRAELGPLTPEKEAIAGALFERIPAEILAQLETAWGYNSLAPGAA